MTVGRSRSTACLEWAGTPSVLDTPAGAESGTISLSYRPNTVDDYPRSRHLIAAFPIAGIATNDYVGGATVVDDDPAPKPTLQPKRTRIHEGATARRIVTLETDRRSSSLHRSDPGKGKRLTVGDRFADGGVSRLPLPGPRTGRARTSNQ